MALEARGARELACTTHELNALNARLKDAANDCMLLTEQVPASYGRPQPTYHRADTRRDTGAARDLSQDLPRCPVHNLLAIIMCSRCSGAGGAAGAAGGAAGSIA